MPLAANPPRRRDVTFLFKLEPGVCSKSYGMNVAGMAGIPTAVRRLALNTASCGAGG